MANGDNAVCVAARPEPPLALHAGKERTVGFRGDIPACIRLCEPMRARRDHAVGIAFLARPVASIAARGGTRLAGRGERG